MLCQLPRPNYRGGGDLSVSLLDAAGPAKLFVLPPLPVLLLPTLSHFKASIMFFRAQLRRALQRVPGKQRFGIYRFLPFFFVLGGTMEWIMIKVRVGQETFCKWGAAASVSPVGTQFIGCWFHPVAELLSL